MKYVSTAAVAAIIVVSLAVGPSAAAVCGDVNANGVVTASDALGVLKVAVHQPFPIDCGPIGSLLATGMSFCTNGDGTLNAACAGTGQDGELQKGAERLFKDNGNGTITDRVTGLMWERMSSDGGIHDRDLDFEWLQAAVKISTLNGISFAGHNDWRLPNANELLTLVNLGASYMATFPEFDDSCADGCTVEECSCSPRYSWTSTTNNASKQQAYIIDWYDGEMFSNSKTLSFQTRAVRGGYTLPADPVLVYNEGSATGFEVDTTCADVNLSDAVTASDSLAVLKKAVGQNVELHCALHRPVLRTGQNKCYGSTGLEIACAGTGQDAALLVGSARAFMNNGDGTITDLRTGLHWEVLSQDLGIHDSGTQYTWGGAISAKIASLNSNNFAGHNDWRVPNQFELMSIVDFGEADPETFAAFDTGCVEGCTPAQCSCSPESGFAWSSTTYQLTKINAWKASFVDGKAPFVSKATLANVRAVRGGW